MALREHAGENGTVAPEGPAWYVAVVGGGLSDRQAEIAAEEVGRTVARAGAVLVCGGLGGVMAAACRGAVAEGGVTVGILPGSERGAANPWVGVAIATGLGEMRNALVVRTADVVIAIAGEYGTLSEVALALNGGRPVVGLGTWKLVRPDGASDRGVVAAADPADAVAKALVLARASHSHDLGPSAERRYNLEPEEVTQNPPQRAGTGGGSAVTEASQRPGWWLASDGRWYPPETHPSRRPAPPARVPEPAAAPTSAPPPASAQVPLSAPAPTSPSPMSTPPTATPTGPTAPPAATAQSLEVGTGAAPKFVVPPVAADLAPGAASFPAATGAPSRDPFGQPQPLRAPVIPAMGLPPVVHGASGSPWERESPWSGSDDLNLSRQPVSSPSTGLRATVDPRGAFVALASLLLVGACFLPYYRVAVSNPNVFVNYTVIAHAFGVWRIAILAVAIGCTLVGIANSALRVGSTGAVPVFFMLRVLVVGQLALWAVAYFDRTINLVPPPPTGAPEVDITWVSIAAIVLALGAIGGSLASLGKR